MGQYLDSIMDYAWAFANSLPMQAIKELIGQAADTTATVLIRGERGVGKDLVARAIHAASPRQGKPLIKVNCETLPQKGLESELFGHEKWAFSEAHRRKLGKFEFANKGTLLVDEIGELPRALQPKFLHALQDHEFSRIGSQDRIRVDVRVIAATQRRPEGSRSRDAFWEALARLDLVEIRIPPLRERKDEIPALASFLLDRFNRQYLRAAALSPETLGLFLDYSWPGNLRELEDLVRRLVASGDPWGIHEEIHSRLRLTGRHRDLMPGA